MANKLTTWQVLRAKFPESEYVLIKEVSDASGVSRSRSLDYMLINLWESRGLAVTGIERKSNRRDWLRELKKPEKQERHFKYCDYFYLLTDSEKVAKVEEIPATWGWYHINDKGILKTMKEAPKLDSQPIGRSLLCAMLKRAAVKDGYVHIDDLSDRITEEAEKIKATKNYEQETKAKEYDRLKKIVDDFEKASGIPLTYAWGETATRTGAAVKVLLNGEVKNYLRNLKFVEERVANIYKGLQEKVAALHGAIDDFDLTKVGGSS